MGINSGASLWLALFFYAVIIGTLVACQRGTTNTLLEPTTAPIPKAPSTPPEGAFWIDPTHELGKVSKPFKIQEGDDRKLTETYLFDAKPKVEAVSSAFKNGDAIHLAAYSVTLYILK